VPLRTLDAIREGLSGRIVGSWALVIIALALLAALLMLVQVMVRQARRHRRLRSDWAQLSQTARRLALNRQQSEVLRQLALRESASAPLEVMERASVFEKAVHRCLNRLAASGADADSVRRAAECVHDLRTKLGFDRMTGTAYCSTRELQRGLPVQLSPLDGRGPEGIAARVRGGREDVLCLEGLEPADESLRGRRLEATFFQGPSAFSFEAEVVDLDPTGGGCTLTHTLDVRAAGLREFHRVSVGKPVTLRAAWEEPAVRRAATLRDLSVGGVGLLCPCYYESGEEVVVSLRPADYVPDARGRNPSLPDRDLPGIIVEARRTEDGRCVYHVEFRDAKAEERRYVHDLVRRIELVARRVGAEE
jgi:hypothetical protein